MEQCRQKTLETLREQRYLLGVFITLSYIVGQIYVMHATRRYFSLTEEEKEKSLVDSISSCHRHSLLVVRDYHDNQGSFQQAGDDTYVYSAYYDNRISKEATVRVIGVSNQSVSLWCHLWFDKNLESNNSRPRVVEAVLHVPNKHFAAVEYENVFIHCPVYREYWNAPKYVVLSPQLCGPPMAVLPVTDPRTNTLETNFTVCLHKALIRGYDDYAQFVEWIEVNKILGAERFVVYNYSGSELLIPYINHYIQEGILEYRKWPLHHIEDKITQYIAQKTLINDCMYRYMYRTKYLVLTDADEFPVPEHHANWAELIHHIPCNNAPSYMFRNTFFIHPHIDPRYIVSTSLSRLQLSTLARTHRFNYSFECAVRSKLILRPEKVVSATVHMVAQLVNNTDNQWCCVPSHIALLKHYRKWFKQVQKIWEEEFNKQGEYNPDDEILIDDTRMYHYAKQIAENVAQVYKAVKREKLQILSDKLGRKFLSDNITRLHHNFSLVWTNWNL